MSLYDSAIDSLRAQRAQLEADLRLWKQRTSTGGDRALHHSQVTRLNDQIAAALSSALAGTPVVGDNHAPFAGTVADLPALRRAVGTLHLLWDFFRDKLAQRDTAAYTQHLGVADDLAWSCYERFLEAARVAGSLTDRELKEPPLVFYSPDRAPFAQARTRALHPPGLDAKDLEAVVEELHRLPVPVIGMPWTVANRLPEVVLVGHEVGHVIAEDLGLGIEAVQVISGLDFVGDDAGKRKRVWTAWSDEIFADIIGVLACGTAFVSGLAAEMAGARQEIEQVPIDVNRPGRYPTPTLRVALCGEVLKQVGVDPPGAWAGTYPLIAGDSSAFKGDIAPLAQSLCDHAWTPIGGQKVTDVLHWNAEKESNAEAVAKAVLLKAQAPVNFDVRVWVAAAMHAALENSEMFQELDLDHTLAAFIISRRKDAVRSSDHHRSIVLSKGHDMAPDVQEAILRSSDREAGLEIASHLQLRP